MQCLFKKKIQYFLGRETKFICVLFSCSLSLVLCHLMHSGDTKLSRPRQCKLYCKAEKLGYHETSLTNINLLC